MEPAPTAPTLDDLLAHAAWVRALARSLVADAGVAEDVVQETWVAALEHPPAHGENPRGWLASVVRNVVRMRGRGGARRTAREREVARGRPEALPSSAELAERLDTQRRLAERVLALDEPYRSTVTLRFYEGLSSAEIARRSNVPAGTVRWRLKAALEELRGRLDDDFGGDRAAWVALCLPLAQRDVALTGVTGGAGLLHGILAMNLGLKITLGISLTALVLLLTPLGATLTERLLPGRALDETPVAVTFSPIEASERSVEASALSSSRRTAIATPPPVQAKEAAEELAAGFRVRVVEANGDPVPGTTVAFSGYVRRGVRTDADGFATVLFGADVPFAEWRTTLQLSHPEYATLQVQGQPDATQVIDLGDVELQPAGTIEGIVVTADGQPASGAWVFVSDPQSWTDDDYRQERARQSVRRGRSPVADELGRFRLERVPVGDVRLWAGRDGDLATLTNPVEVRRGMMSSGLEITLGVPNPKDFITGQVLRPDGTPAARANLQYRYSSRSGSGSGGINTDAEGSFRIAYAPAAPFSLRAQDQGRRFRPARATDVRGGDHVVLQLFEAQLLELTFEGEGQPIVSPVIRALHPTRPQVLVQASEVHGVEGSFRVPVPNEAFLIEVTADGYERTTIGPLDGLQAPRELHVELRVIRGLRGRVVANGKPLADASVELYAPAVQRTVHNGFPVRVQPNAKVRGRSGPDGTFDITFRDEGEYLVRVSAEGYAAAEAGPLWLTPAQGHEGLVLELAPGGAIEGRVSVAEGRAGGRIVAASRADGHARTTRCGSDGSYRFERLTPGRWQVQLTDEELVPGRHETTSGGPFRESDIEWNCEVREGETTHYDLTRGVRPDAEVLGRLVIDGAGADGWIATLTRPSDGDLVDNPPTASLDSDGAFRLSVDEPGDYRLTVSARGGGLRLVTSLVTLPPGSTEWSAAFTTGEVHLSGVGEPVRTHLDLLVAERDRFTFVRSLLPAADGVTRLSGIPAGSCSVKRYRPDEAFTVDPRAFGRVLHQLEVSPGETVESHVP